MQNPHTDPMGLPAPQRQVAPGMSPLDAPSPERDGYEYTLPARIMELPSWRRHGSQFSAADLAFVVGEPTAKDEEDANKFAPNNMLGMMSRLEQLCLLKIGSRLVRRNQALIDGWYKAIGNPGRKMVEAAFMENYKVDPAEVEGMLSAGKPVAV